MTDKVFIFGDSFMYGEESHIHTLDQEKFMNDLNKVIGREVKLNKDGIPVKPFNAKEQAKYVEFINDMIGKIYTHPTDNSIGALLAKKLNVQYIMKALSGNSNNTIYKTFLDKLPLMTADSIVIYGLTEPSRKSYYEGPSIARHPHGYVTSCWRDITELSGWNKYQEMDLMFGDDATSRVLQTYSYITSAKALCPGKVFFIDPFHHFCDNKYHPDIPKNYIRRHSLDYDGDVMNFENNYRHLDLIKYLEKQLKDIVCYGISEVFEEVADEGNPIQCINGHYSKYVYERYVDKVLLDAL